jgi:hypothetical protein
MKSSVKKEVEDYILNLKELKDSSMSGEELVENLWATYLLDSETKLKITMSQFDLVLLG